jgi:hypothetical protein
LFNLFLFVFLNKQNIMEKFTALLFGFIYSFLNLNAQNIYTFAGSGTSGYSGDGGSAQLAQIGSLYGITCDAAGNVYFSDDTYHIRKISTTGIITTIAGTGTSGYSGDGGPAINAQIIPAGLGYDNTTGNLYFVDGYFRIRMINSGGTITTVAGNGTSGDSGDGGPATSAQIGVNPVVGVYADGLGNFYIANLIYVRKVNSSGIISTIAGNGVPGYTGDGVAATGTGMGPAGVITDASGNLYIGDATNKRIRKVNTSGIISTVAGNGTTGYSGDGGAATSANITVDGGIIPDGAGGFIFSGGNRLRKVNSTGIISTIAGVGVNGFGGDAGPATSATLTAANICSDASNNIYITQTNYRIREICMSACPLAGIHQISSDKIKLNLSPNPNQGNFKLEGLEGLNNEKIVLKNILGQTVYEENITSNQAEVIIRTNNLPKAIYICEVLEKNSTVASVKFIIE